MEQSTSGLVRLLVGAILVEVVIAVVVRGAALGRLASGQGEASDYLAIFGLAWLAVLVAVLWAAWRRLTLLQDQVEERDEHIAGLEATTHEWLWQATPEMTVTYSSPGSMALVGYSPEQLVGRNMIDLLDPEDAVVMRDALAEAIRNGSGWSDMQLRWRHIDGHAVLLEGSAVPVRDRAGRLLGFRGSRRAVPTESASMKRLAAITHRTRAVLEDHAVRIALQPIVELSSGRLVGVESLARFPDNCSPATWFAEAHEAGVGIELERAAFEAALAVLPQLPEPVYVSVNASPALVLDPGFRETVERAEPFLDRVVVEITEHAAVTRYDDIRTALVPLRERGVRLAVDDTGAGYASFNHVLRLRPDIIKLDRSLLMDIGHDPARRAVVTAVVLMALELGASVTGEGVETTDELEVLRMLGVDAVQGHLLSRPVADPRPWSGWVQRRWLTPAPAMTLRTGAHARL